MKNCLIIAFSLLIVSASATFAQTGGVIDPGQGVRLDPGGAHSGDAGQNVSSTRSTGWKMGLNEEWHISGSVAGSTLTLTSKSLVLRMDDPMGSPREAWSESFSGTAKVMEFQSDGNLVVYSTDNKVLWSSGTSGGKNSILVLRASGTLEIDMGGGRWWKK
ncbi:MAG: hypothetical protein H7319_13275 [Spirosoma sp.]|nr:hypothetical protein [Spirosoma sp.]